MPKESVDSYADRDRFLLIMVNKIEVDTVNHKQINQIIDFRQASGICERCQARVAIRLSAG